MATGGVPIVRNSASEPRVRGPGNGAPSRGSRQPTSVDDIFRFNWIGDKDEDKPNNYVSWLLYLRKINKIFERHERWDGKKWTLGCSL